jgi:hypothetical protein
MAFFSKLFTSRKTFELKVLNAVVANGGSATFGQIYNHLCTHDTVFGIIFKDPSIAKVTTTIDRLRSFDWLLRTTQYFPPTSSDKPKRLYTITDAGREYLTTK